MTLGCELVVRKWGERSVKSGKVERNNREESENNKSQVRSNNRNKNNSISVLQQNAPEQRQMPMGVEVAAPLRGMQATAVVSSNLIPGPKVSLRAVVVKAALQKKGSPASSDVDGSPVPASLGDEEVLQQNVPEQRQMLMGVEVAAPLRGMQATAVVQSCSRAVDIISAFKAVRLEV